MTTLKIRSKQFRESMLIRANLSEASSQVQVDYLGGGGWSSTQYQTADAKHTDKGLAEIGVELLAAALECDVEDLGRITVTEID